MTTRFYIKSHNDDELFNSRVSAELYILRIYRSFVSSQINDNKNADFIPVMEFLEHLGTRISDDSLTKLHKMVMDTCGVDNIEDALEGGLDALPSTIQTISLSGSKKKVMNALKNTSDIKKIINKHFIITGSKDDMLVFSEIYDTVSKDIDGLSKTIIGRILTKMVEQVNPLLISTKVIRKERIRVGIAKR